MIKFFRKIRKKLLTKNKVTQYLLYAVGEIVFVIIGILIALGINEYVKNQKKIELRNLYIIQLDDEANSNIKKLIDSKNRTNAMIKDLDTLIYLLASEKYDSPQIAKKSNTLYTLETFHPIMTTYENLKFSGDLKLFDDLNLRHAISKSYDTFSSIETVESYDAKGVRMYHENFLLPNVSFWEMRTSSKSYAKKIYFQNFILARSLTLRQKKAAYENSIDYLKQLKATFAKLKNDN